VTVQYSLFGGAPPHVAGSKTSKAAAQQIASPSGVLRQTVLDYLRKQGPLTDEQMQVGLAMNPSTQRPRRVELVKLGFVEDTGTTRKTTSGRKAAIWRAK
jgi:hypothetical protein